MFCVTFILCLEGFNLKYADRLLPYYLCVYNHNIIFKWLMSFLTALQLCHDASIKEMHPCQICNYLWVLTCFVMGTGMLM